MTSRYDVTNDDTEMDAKEIDEWVFAAKRTVGDTERIGSCVVRVVARDWFGYMRVSISRQSEEGGVSFLLERSYKVKFGVVVQ